MKKLIPLLVILFAYNNSFSQLTYVPDDGFEQVIINYGLDDVLDDYVLTSNLILFTNTLDIRNHFITDLTGLEDFVNLKNLLCGKNSFTNLDLSNGPASLELVNCDNSFIFGAMNRITDINLSGCPNLTTLNLTKNNLNNLDLSNNPLLISVYANFNSLTSIDLSNATNLSELILSNNKLTSINLMNTTSLTNLNLYNNKLNAIDLSNNINLTELYIGVNQLSSLDISQNTLLNRIEADNNLLTNINLNNSINLNYLKLNNNNLNTINLLSTINLTELHLKNNSLGNNIDFSNNTLLNTLDASNNVITAINLNGLTNLISLTLNYNNINTINLSSANNLALLFIDNNQLTALDVSQNTNLILASCNNNNITSINSMSNSLQYLFCYNNALTQLDLTNNPQLLNLLASNNSISTIDVSNNLLLNELTLSNNNLSIIDVTNNVALTKLTLKQNNLTSINVNNNVNLTQLSLSNNQLKRLDVTQNINLKYFYCENNQLAYIDLNNCSDLFFAFLEYNNLIEVKVQNGNNQNMYIKGKNNPDLTCVEVDDSTYSTTNWTGSFFDAQANFSLDCDYAAIWYDNVWSYLPSIANGAIVLENYETLNQGDLEAKDLTIYPNTQLTVGANSFVKLEQDFINNGSIIIENQGSFLQNDNNATITGTGNYSTKINTTNLLDEDRFTYFSSPVANQNLEVFNTFANMSKLWRFDEAIQDWFIVPPSTIMSPAVGYAIQGAQDVGQYPLIGNTNFNGSFNNGIFSYPLTFNPGGIDDDNSLVGNPYPSAIDASLLLNNNPNANAFYFWTHDSALLSGGYAGDDYAVWNNSGGIASGSGSSAPSGFIASGQGFFVDAIGSGNFVFNNNVRVTGSNNDFRVSEDTNRNRIWLNLTNNENLFSQILLNFTEFGTTNLDTKLDAKRLNTRNPISLYSIGNNDNEYFAIQALPSLQDYKIVPLAFNVSNENISDLIISIDHLEFQNEFNIYLKDNLLNTIHNLKQVNYNFSVTETGINSNRFELIFNRITLDNEGFSNQIQKIIITNNSKTTLLVKTNNNTIITNFNIYDVLGKLLLKMNPNKSSFIIDKNTFFKEGTILIVNAKLESGQILNTKIISN